MTEKHVVEREIAGRTLRLESGQLAKQAAGAVLVRYGDTVVLSAVVSADPRPGIDFFPLTVDYREKYAAVGKFPGGFMKREGRPSTKEILTMRQIDRPCRPLFPKGYKDEVQIQAMVLSADQENDSDILAMIGAFAALTISDIPFDGPLGAVRVGRVDDELVVNPTFAQRGESTLDMLLGGHKEAVNMIEVGANELSEDIIAEAIELGHQAVIEICEMISELTEKCGSEKMPYEVPDTSELVWMLEAKVGADYRRAREIEGKRERGSTIRELLNGFKSEVCPEGEDEPKYGEELVRMAVEDFEEKVVRDEVMANRRAGGRGSKELREISGETAILPRTHGSAIFTRGETQALVTTTLGTLGDGQIVDGLSDEYRQKFMVHYNFPPFSVGECRRIMGPSRRDIGHGMLAERSLERVLPDPEVFPYTIKLVSDILESNGSSSMATVCGGTLALMDAGVPIQRPVAGISIGMVSEGDKYELITDIMGEEDHYGDMDFKVAGTQNGITGIQLDLKARGISMALIRETLTQAREARIDILKTMLGVLAEPREAISTYAPQLVTTQIPVEMIGKIIGPGGKEIKRIQETTGTNIDIDDDGTIHISCVGGNGHLQALDIIKLMTTTVEVGQKFMGKVVSTKDFGAFIEIAPGVEGLCHISELADQYVKSVTDICSIGDEFEVQVIAVDETGRIKLSRKAAMLAAAAEE